jgi:YHS domain-containing protein
MTSRIDDFTCRIAQIVSRADEPCADEMPALTAEMEQRLHRQTVCERLAERLHDQAIRPRVAILGRQIPGSRVHHLHTTTGIFSVFALPQTERFPASATLSLGITFDVGTLAASVSYDQRIVPVLMEFEGRDDLPVQLEAPDMEAVIGWIEHVLETFVETCLRLERDPRYRRSARFTDPVCGMVLHGGSPTHRAQAEDRVYHFCSAACRERFEANPAFYLQRHPIPLADAAPALVVG